MGGRFLLGADIGGTFSRFALFRLEKEAGGLSLLLLPESKITLSTRESGSFAGLLERLRRALPSGGAGACSELACASLAVPGPVENGLCLAPNIPWPLALSELEKTLGCPGSLLNDFAAQGRACLFPSLLGLKPVLPGVLRPERSAAVLGAGTGLGKSQILPPFRPEAPEQAGNRPGEKRAGLYFDHASLRPEALAALERRVLPSEGGHALFPFRGEEEAAFESFARRLGRRLEVIGDMVVTGCGLSLLYAFHQGEEVLRPPEEIVPLLRPGSPVLEWFARFYARACRDFALETLALGGVYISGGLAGRLPGLLEHPAFAEEFRRSETQAHLLANLRVCRISSPDAGLWGSAVHGLSLGEWL
ncbi:MAG: glucokinase [Deltaproteobacteria bacterium]|jgi:glucokinase|nr:glucokinase [Deltaproteobacteria bacterium]